ncbi:unnamed protein product, partial [Amoebophrya sp. A120]|eukprot:GSA120T00021901001.1
MDEFGMSLDAPSVASSSAAGGAAANKGSPAGEEASSDIAWEQRRRRIAESFGRVTRLITESLADTDTEKPRQEGQRLRFLLKERDSESLARLHIKRQAEALQEAEHLELECRRSRIKRQQEQEAMKNMYAKVGEAEERLRLAPSVASSSAAGGAATNKGPPATGEAEQLRRIEELRRKESQMLDDRTFLRKEIETERLASHIKRLQQELCKPVEHLRLERDAPSVA